MGKNKKGYNWQARSAPSVEIDKKSANSVEIDLNVRKENYDECNSLVLPSKKRKTIKKDKQGQNTRLLSKKRRKQLEKVLEKKQKKQRRAGLLEDLAKVQATPEELKQYVSITAIQTKGLKRHFREENEGTKYVEAVDDEDGQGEVVNAIKGSKKRRLMALKEEVKEKFNDDPNVVGLDESESDGSDEEDGENDGDDEQKGQEDVCEAEEEENVEVNSKETVKKPKNKDNLGKNGKIPKSDKHSQEKKEKTEKLDKTTKKTKKSKQSDENSEQIDKTSKKIKKTQKSEENKEQSKKPTKSEQKIEKTKKLNKKSKPVDEETPLNSNNDKLLTDENQSSKPVDRKPAVFIGLNRTPEIQAARMKLPVLAEEQIIVEAINENPVVIITGETGSGKTTQVPQFLYEAGYAENRLIGVTEPRRVAAISMSKRVAEEMNLTSDEVSYLIRFEGNTTDKTKIKFMTDGVLLKEVQTDFLLTKYSVIILDEAHERSVYTDILIGLLSRIVPMRHKRNDPLKLIIMSATLRVEDFLENSRLFKVKPPLIRVDSRQFPVTIHFNRRTNTNYVLDAVKKAAKIHTKLPDGGILIFLTGQHEVNTVVRKLRKLFPYKRKPWEKTKAQAPKEPENAAKTPSDDEAEETDSEEEFNAKTTLKRLKSNKKLQEIALPSIDLDAYASIPEDDTQCDLFDDDDPEDENIDEDEDDDDFAIDLRNSSNQPMWVLPLYSLLPANKQARVFGEVPEGCRLCVVSTNVAETSLTIPNVKYVVDSGKCKTRMYDKVTGVSTFRVTWTSQAGANQRAGRAGRMGPGHCYRLYSSAVFNDQFEQFSVPEIQRKPVDDLVLQMKVMNIVKVVNFPFPSPPDHDQLIAAEKRLRILGALEPKKSSKDEFSAKVTPLGKSISAFPVAPRFGKMLAISQQENLLKFTICMVSALAVQEVLVEGLGSENSHENKKKWLQTRRFWAGTGNSLLLGDPMVLIRAVGAAAFADSQRKLPKFCEENGLRPKAVAEIKKLRNQLSNEIAINVPGLELGIDPKMAPPTDKEAKMLRQIVLAGMADQIARKMNLEEVSDEDRHKFKFAYKTLEMEDPVFMHSSCVLRKNLPEWVVYQEIYETNKVYMRGVTAIEPEWLPRFAPALCNLGEPLVEPPPRFDEDTGKVMCHVSGTFGRAGWELPPMEVEFPTNIDGVRWFARFFLEGAVFGKLKRFAGSLLSGASTVNKSWAKLIPRTEAISRALLGRGVMNRDKLMEVWKEDRSFLLKEYQMWVPEAAHAEVCTIWPPV